MLKTTVKIFLPVAVLIAAAMLASLAHSVHLLEQYVESEHGLDKFIRKSPTTHA